MCGITGLIDFNHKSSIEITEKMAACMPHRGPDDQGKYFETTEQCQIGLAHRRLSIIDLSQAADQPMHFGELSIVFNGEIYNYNEIRNKLIKLGHTFKTHSDTEIILHSWKEWGEKAISKWHGMFAIAILDKANSTLTCIRDRPGVKPFNYYFSNDLFLFGSELKCLMAHPHFSKKINHNAVAAFLQYGNVPTPHSIFEHTYKIPAGHLLQLNMNTKNVELRQYWNVYDYYNKPKIQISLPDAISETEKILKRAFQYRMVADVPVGVFLSGGYDSSCVTALLQKDSTEKLKTFTIGTTDNKLNEAPFAKQIADFLGTDHTEYYCTPKETLDIIPELPFYFDEPFADSSAIPTILVSRLAKKHVTVALSADAGDEIFAGYNRYDYISRYANKLQTIPASVRKIMAGSMSLMSSKYIPILSQRPNFHSRYNKLRNLLLDPSPANLLKNLSLVFTNDEIDDLFKKEITQLKTLYTSTELEKDYFDGISFLMVIDYQTYLVDDILQKVDRATMSTSLEGREPFLDQSIIEWAAKLPTYYKYHNGSKKHILKQIVHQYIPKEIMERPKMGFSIPVEDWMANELKPLLMEYLGDDALRKHKLFNSDVVGKLVNDFFNGKKEKFLKIWHLLMFQMWHARWIEQ